jgi:hypothetical protein
MRQTVAKLSQWLLFFGDFCRSAMAFLVWRKGKRKKARRLSTAGYLSMSRKRA